jgi:hypothetical protein
MIERHDRDGDGKVSIDEFPGPDEHFTRIDLDGDGFINKNEARRGPVKTKTCGKRPSWTFMEDNDGDIVHS